MDLNVMVKGLPSVVAVACLSLPLVGCNDNLSARQFGGSKTIIVERGYKVVNATWKDNDVWYFVEPYGDGYEPKTKRLIQASQYGVCEGTVVFVEK